MNSPQSAESRSAFILFMTFLLLFQTHTLARCLWQVARISSTFGLPNLARHLISQKKITVTFLGKKQWLAMTGDGMMARTTLVFLQVLDVFFQSFIHATRVKLTIRYMVWRNFSPFLMIKSWLGFFFSCYFCSLGYSPLAGKNRVFSPEWKVIEGMKSLISSAILCSSGDFWSFVLLHCYGV